MMMTTNTSHVNKAICIGGTFQHRCQVCVTQVLSCQCELFETVLLALRNAAVTVDVDMCAMEQKS